MYEEEPTIFDKTNNIHYRIVKSPQYDSTTSPSFFGSDIGSSNNNNSSNNHHNETLVLAFHSSLICFKIALCVLL